MAADTTGQTTEPGTHCGADVTHTHEVTTETTGQSTQTTEGADHAAGPRTASGPFPAMSPGCLDRTHRRPDQSTQNMCHRSLGHGRLAGGLGFEDRAQPLTPPGPRIILVFFLFLITTAPVGHGERAQAQRAGTETVGQPVVVDVLEELVVPGGLWCLGGPGRGGWACRRRVRVPAHPWW